MLTAFRLKLVIALLTSAYLGSALFLLHHYKTRNSVKALRALLCLTGLLLAAGLGLRAKSLMAFFYPILASWAAMWAWRQLGLHACGWKLHAGRGVALAAVVGPLAAVRFRTVSRLGGLSELAGSGSYFDVMDLDCWGVPGFLLVGLLAATASDGLSHSRNGATTLRHKVVRASLLLGALPLIGWYAAGMVNVHRMAGEGQVLPLRLAIAFRPQIAEAFDVDCGFGTPLRFAASKGQSASARVLLEAGATPNVRDRLGKTPLHHAAADGDQETVRLLLCAGADPNAQNNLGQSPLYAALLHGNHAVVELLVNSGAALTGGPKGKAPLHFAADFCDASIVRLLLRLGADSGVLDQRGRSALHYAAANGSTDAIKALLVSGADPLLSDNEGATPSLLARQNGNSKAIEAIEKAVAARRGKGEGDGNGDGPRIP